MLISFMYLANVAAFTGHIHAKFHIGDFCENLSRSSKFGQNLANLTLDVKTWGRFIVAGDTKSP